MQFFKFFRNLTRRYNATFSEIRFHYYSTNIGNNNSSTIYALASGSSRSAISVIRVSGKETETIIREISGKSDLIPRRASLRKLYDMRSKTLIDYGLVLWFPGPKSYTGENCCEFHIHGSLAVISSLMKCINTFPNTRLAEPGEFTRRAFLNGKMDLTEIDGLYDLINAETEQQASQALNQMSGNLRKLYESWRERIAKILANSEAYIDFGEDDNIESDILDIIENDIEILIGEIKIHLGDKRKGEILRNGIKIAILGKPNVGKSSLLNLLCQRQAAIVSSIPGTTRDVLESTINLSGFPVRFCDTAGIRSQTNDEIEIEGIKRAFTQAKEADLIILLLDYEDLKCANFNKKRIISKIFQDVHDDSISTILQNPERILLVMNKLDLSRKEISGDHAVSVELKENELIFKEVDAQVSCKTNEGFNSFLEKLTQRIGSISADPKSSSVYLTRERYRVNLTNCIANLHKYQNSSSNDLALKTRYLKNSLNSIGAITGHYSTEDILDIIFKDFCIGK